jgi:hypothetical protein
MKTVACRISSRIASSEQEQFDLTYRKRTETWVKLFDKTNLSPISMQHPLNLPCAR